MLVSRSMALIAVVVAGCSCASSVSHEPAMTNTPERSRSAADEEKQEKALLELRFDQTTPHEDLELRWLELDDSRCPIGVNCIWEGEIKVRLEAVRGEEEAVEVELALRAGHAPREGTAHGYVLRLLGVDPHPKQGVTPGRGDYVARVEVDPV